MCLDLRPILCLCLVYFAQPLCADWPNWRGPLFNGSGDGEFSYPVEFSPTKGVKWVVDLSGPSASTPIIYSNKVFLSGTHIPSDKTQKPKLVAMCIDRANGNILWSENPGTGYQPGKFDGTPIQLDSRSNYSSPSPVATKQVVVFFYITLDLWSIF